MKNRIPILMYHQVTPNPHPNFIKYSVTPRIFALHMKLLKLLRYNSINFSDLVDYKQKGISLPSKPVIITFDDGLHELIENAVPALEMHGFTAVFYIVTDLIGKKSSWMVPETGVEFPIMDCNTIRQLDSKGFQIGSHCMNHPYLSHLAPKDCYHELEGSRMALEDLLGHEILHLAYPNGSFNENVRSIAKEIGYHTACTSISRIAKPNDDLFMLPRVVIKGTDTVVDFVFKLYTAKTLSAYLKNKMRNGKLPGERIRN